VLAEPSYAPKEDAPCGLSPTLPLFHTHTTLDPTVASNFSDSESNTKLGSQLLLNLTPLSSLTPLGTITPTQTASPPIFPNMTATSPRMPIRGQNLAPKFEGTAPSLNHFFSDFEYLTDISQLTKAQKKHDIVRYLSTKDTNFWTQQPQWADASATWNNFKNTIQKAYPGSEPTKRNHISDMDTLVGAAQCIGICDLAEFSNFYRKFCMIVEYLSSQNRIGNREISTNFLRTLPADLQHKIMFCIQVSDPNWHVDNPHTLKSLFNASVHILKGNTILDTMNPYTIATAYLQPLNPAVQQPQVAQQLPVNYLQNMYIPGTSISLPYSYYQPLAPPAPFPYHQQTVLVQPPAPAPEQPNTYQLLPYTLGLKQEDIMTIATAVALAFAKQLTPLFQQQPRGNTGQNNGQNQGAFTCAFCGQASHGICDCTVAQTYVTKSRVWCKNSKLVMPDGSQITRSQPGKLLKECVDRVQQVRTSVVFEIVSPTVQEALDDQAISQVNIQMQIDSKAKDKIDADIEAYKYTIFELRKKKKKFDVIELPACSKGRAPAVALPPKQAAAPKPTAPTQPAPAIIPKPAKPFVLTTFEALKQQQEPNFRYTAPIEDRAMGNTLFNRMLDTQITVATCKILATAPEVRKSFKDATTTRKVPTSVNPAKVYVDTNTQSENQVQCCCHKV
jgi:hypothetical protein